MGPISQTELAPVTFLAMIFVSFWILARSSTARIPTSHWDWPHLSEIAEISPRLQRSGPDCRDLTMMFVAFFKSQLRHSKIFFILLRLARSRCDFQVFLNQWDLAKILSRFAKTQTSYQHCLHPPRPRLDLEKTGISLRSPQHCHHLAQSDRIVKNSYHIYSIKCSGCLFNFWTFRVGAYSRLGTYQEEYSRS